MTLPLNKDLIKLKFKNFTVLKITSKEKDDFMQPINLTPKQLAERWHLLETTLSQWRWMGKGPLFLKAGSCISYPLEEVKKFEDMSMQHTITQVDDVAFLKIQLENGLKTKGETQ